jgi:phosphoglycerate kinase
MPKLSVSDLNARGQRVLIRVDFNVPLDDKDGRMIITDETRIRETLPTLRLLLDQGAKVIIASHLGRPDGQVVPSMSLAPVATRLGELLQKTVRFVPATVGPDAHAAVAALQPGEALVLENVRFHPGEEANDPAFAAQLAELADLYVNDAFGTAHRAHASTEGVARVIAQRGGKCASGLLIARELVFLGDELDQPARPFVVILGGAKVSDKIKVIDRLIDKADAILIGGAMAYTFKLAQGASVGLSLVEKDRTDIALKALEKARQRGIQFLLPTDNIVVTPVDSGKKDKKGRPKMDLTQPRVNAGDNIPDTEEGVDIGPDTIRTFADVLSRAKTILWNGPMGIFEDPRFAEGTFAVARAVAEATRQGAKSIIGGGDSVKAINRAQLGDQVTFMSTGGGASLEFLEGKTLPGVAALNDQ